VRILGLLSILSSSLLFAAQAAVIVTPVTTSSGANTSYDYTVSNTEPLGIILFELTLPQNPESVQAPSDWLVNTFNFGGIFTVQWASVVSEIAPNRSLSGFIVVGSQTSGPVEFAATDTEFNTINGTTTGPVLSIAAVPEPSNLLPTVLAIAISVLVRRK